MKKNPPPPPLLPTSPSSTSDKIKIALALFPPRKILKKRLHIRIDSRSGWWLKGDPCDDKNCPLAHAYTDAFSNPPSWCLNPQRQHRRPRRRHLSKILRLRNEKKAPPPPMLESTSASTPSYKDAMSSKRNTKKYQQENGRLYGCWSCKRTDLQLRLLGRNAENLKLYGCPDHLQKMEERKR